MTELDCRHPGTAAGRVCRHLLADPEGDHLRRFTGAGTAFDLVCPACVRDDAVDLQTACEACFGRARDRGCWDGVVGTPEVRERPTDLAFVHEEVGPVLPADDPALDLRPVPAVDRQLWAAVTRSGLLVRLDLDAGTAAPIARLGESAVDPARPVSLYLSADGRLAAVVNTRGRHGAVFDLDSGSATMALDRGDYRTEHSDFPVAFAEVDGRTVLIHGTAWNRLDASDPRTGELLTARPTPTYRRGEPRPAHYLDYFHGGLAVSPTGAYVADNGWVWSPVGVVVVWDVRRWLRGNPWESEDGPSKRALCLRAYYWDGPLCWVGGDRLAVWGYGADEEELIPAARVFDAATGSEDRWFAGPRGDMVCDGYLFACDPAEGTSVWDAATGERLLHDGGFRPRRYHPGAKTFLTVLADGRFRVSRLRRPSGSGGLGRVSESVIQITRGVRADRAYDRLPILADALEEAGCEDAEVLGHCRNPGPHAGRCWVVDRVLDANDG